MMGETCYAALFAINNVQIIKNNYYFDLVVRPRGNAKDSYSKALGFKSIPFYTAST